MSWQVVWADEETTHDIVLPNSADVLALLDSLNAKNMELKPVVEILRHPQGFPSFSVAVGSPETVATFQESRKPPYFISLGDRHRAGKTEPFFHGGQEIDHWARNAISWLEGMEALREFLDIGGQPKCIQWEKL